MSPKWGLSQETYKACIALQKLSQSVSALFLEKNIRIIGWITKQFQITPGGSVWLLLQLMSHWLKHKTQKLREPAVPASGFGNTFFFLLEFTIILTFSKYVMINV